MPVAFDDVTYSLAGAAWFTGILATTFSPPSARDRGANPHAIATKTTRTALPAVSFRVFG